MKAASAKPPRHPGALYFEQRCYVWRNRPYMQWSALAVVMLAGLAAVHASTPDRRYVLVMLPLAIGTSIVPLAYYLAVKALESWKHLASTFVVAPSAAFGAWFDQEMRAFRGGRLADVLGTVIACASLIAYWMSRTFSGLSTVGTCLSAFIVAASGFMAGIGLYGLFCVGRLVWRLGRYQVKVEHHPAGIRSTGRMLLKPYALAACVWFVITLSAASDWAGFFYPTIALALPCVLFIACSFVICQIPLHKRMLEYKYGNIVATTSLIEQIMPSRAEDLDEARIKQLEFWKARIDYLSGLPEWPFTLKSLSGILVSAVGAVAPIVIPVLESMLTQAL